MNFRKNAKFFVWLLVSYILTIHYYGQSSGTPVLESNSIHSSYPEYLVKDNTNNLSQQSTFIAYQEQPDKEIALSDTMKSGDKTELLGAEGKKQKLPWKLKHLNAKTTANSELWKAFQNDQVQLQLDYTSQGIIVRSTTPLQLLDVLKNRKDGIAIELVNPKSYTCGSKEYYTTLGRRTGSSSTNGTVLKPIYKKEFLRDLTKQRQKFEQLQASKARLSGSAKNKKAIDTTTWQPEAISVLAGAIPQNDSSKFVTANFLLIHKKRIVGVVHYTDICGDLSLRDSLPLTPQLVTTPLDFSSEDKSFSFQIPFARNSISPDHASMEVVRDTLKNYQIDRILIDAFASIEGIGKMNKQLYQSRADSIVGYLRKYIDHKTTITVQTGENWELFYQQLAQSPNPEWKSWSKTRIKQELQKPGVLKAWEKYLDEQRSASVRLETHLNVRDTLTYVQKYYKAKTAAQAAALQSFYYRQCKAGKISPNMLFSVRYPETEEYNSLYHNQMMMDYECNRQHWTEEQWINHWHNLQTILTEKDSQPEMQYYAMNFILSEWDFVKSQNYKEKDILKIIQQVTSSDKYKSFETKARSIFYINTLPGYLQAGNYRKEGVDFLFTYYISQSAVIANRNTSLQLANFLIEMEAFKPAIQVLDNYLKKTAFDENIYTQYLKLVSLHPDYQQKRAYTKLLIEASQKLSPAKWCDLFMGDCGINFQVFDDEELRNLHCEKCAGIGNEAKQKQNNN
ncbi:hypothetical protein QNI16_08725 [Cytophagaceae bacterium YF14B1]|uniref:OmpA-like domain-containing protein n=1 Tax=Xanthocytophaga flava TaxID=3048013 RepID=A0AAE3QP72_9BACT|nr:hypothetical protein [Xanthocytophaga flavus]MDJ1480566.1 hypothetical protein [Xanthocytophaga flavus]